MEIHEAELEESAQELEQKHFDAFLDDENRGTWLSPFLSSSKEVKADDCVLDIGCGDGRVLILAALKTGCQGLGYDISADCISNAQRLSHLHQVEHLLTFQVADFSQRSEVQKLPLERCTVIFLYVYPTFLQVLEPLVKQLHEQRGMAVVTLVYHFPHWEPDVRDSESNLQLYQRKQPSEATR